MLGRKKTDASAAAALGAESIQISHAGNRKTHRSAQRFLLLGHPKPRFLLITRKRLVATASRREGVYNRAGEPSVTFCGEEERRRARAAAKDAAASGAESAATTQRRKWEFGSVPPSPRSGDPCKYCLHVRRDNRFSGEKGCVKTLFFCRRQKKSFLDSKRKGAYAHWSLLPTKPSGARNLNCLYVMLR